MCVENLFSFFFISAIRSYFIPSFSRITVFDCFYFHNILPTLLYIHLSGALIQFQAVYSLSSCLRYILLSNIYNIRRFSFLTYSKFFKMLVFSFILLSINFVIPILFLGSVSHQSSSIIIYSI